MVAKSVSLIVLLLLYSGHPTCEAVIGSTYHMCRMLVSTLYLTASLKATPSLFLDQKRQHYNLIVSVVYFKGWLNRLTSGSHTKHTSTPHPYHITPSIPFSL